MLHIANSTAFLEVLQSSQERLGVLKGRPIHLPFGYYTYTLPLLVMLVFCSNLGSWLVRFLMIAPERHFERGESWGYVLRDVQETFFWGGRGP